MKRFSALFLSLVMLLCLLSGCGGNTTEPQKEEGTTTVSTTTSTTAGDTTTTTEGTTDAATTDTTEGTTTVTTTVTTDGTTVTTTTVVVTPAVKAKLNGVSLSEYTIVLSADALDYADRAAEYIRDEIRTRTGAELKIVTDNKPATKHEIVVGETNRAISKSLNAKTEGLQFSMMAKDGHVAMEGDYFIIAAAAYYFVTTYVTGKNASTTVPSTAFVKEPIQEKANNYIMLIGDGMGINQTHLPEVYNHDRFESEAVEANNFTDGENFFYGYLFPNQGYARTHEIGGGVTDSAASGTALATGSKTTNGRIGRDKDKNDLKSITEIAGDLGMATAVMSTEGRKGATPAAFCSHADARDMYDEIVASQEETVAKYGTLIKCDYDYYTGLGISYYMERTITNTLNELDKNEKGFFMMYEEAYIDKHSHNQDLEKATWAVYRFNQAIGLFMEYAFYHPDTMVLITADHETGGLTDLAGVYKYSHGDHTAKLVPVFAYGVGTEVFHDQEIENVQIPKTIAKMMGQTLFPTTDGEWPPLN